MKYYERIACTWVREPGKIVVTFEEERVAKFFVAVGSHFDTVPNTLIQEGNVVTILGPEEVLTIHESTFNSEYRDDD